MFMHTHTQTHTHTPITKCYVLDDLVFEFFRAIILVDGLNRPHGNLVPNFLVCNALRGFFPGLKWPVREGYHSSPSSADVKMSVSLIKVRFQYVNR